MNRQQIKKWSLLRHLNFKGYKRTASGNPLNMVKVMFPSQLTICGNAVQDGTPSPDAPVEVQLCGDKTGNLFDIGELEDNSGGYVENGNIYNIAYLYITNISPNKFLKMTGLKPGDYFTSNANYERFAELQAGAEDIRFISRQGSNFKIIENNGLYTNQIPADFNSDNYNNMYIYGGSAGTDDGSPRAVWSNLAIYKGSYTADTMPAYEPYQPPQDFAVYLPEQIAKVGDVADEVVVDMEKQTAELKKNVGSMTMSDSYSGGISITDELVRFYHGTTPLRRISPSTNIIDVMSDIYEADTWNNLGTGSTDKQFVIAGNPNTQVVNVRVPKSVIGGETNELMNAWAANNPATVYYPLAEPVTTDITSLQQWDAMPQVSGTVTITFDSAIPISNAETEYYSKEYDAT